ncbi:MAG TPA: hypothetical protein VLN47_06255, partial [Clostridiaceae bacterium]|nr:hypothetical protein [Clostridiaceae bacterium]
YHTIINQLRGMFQKKRRSSTSIVLNPEQEDINNLLTPGNYSGREGLWKVLQIFCSTGFQKIQGKKMPPDSTLRIWFSRPRAGVKKRNPCPGKNTRIRIPRFGFYNKGGYSFQLL